ncbi:Palmitoyltransferase PFA4 [Rhypophila sp. PSN 637]
MRGLKTGPSSSPSSGLQCLMIPGVCLLVSFLGYGSQLLFYNSPDLAPGPLTSRQTKIFNLLILCLWWTYYKAVTVDPGRYYPFPPPPPSSTHPSPDDQKSLSSSKNNNNNPRPPPPPPRWCKKCNTPKPPRSHHCRHCGRCIPKMDHHCPWTANCVSMQTFPYFLRFLLYTNLSLWMLAYFLGQRLASIWADRHLPAYLGPTLPHLILLVIMSLTCLGAMAALGILLYTTVKGWVLNSTMIEDWEVERHEAILARCRSDDSDYWGLDGGGGRLQLEAIEFPYDLGFFQNMAQAMGTRNVLLWFFPFARGPVISTTVPGKGTGWEWEENGFNPRTGMWPPLDPEKARRGNVGWPGAAERVRIEEEQGRRYETAEERKAAFAERQEADLRRRRTQLIAELEEVEEDEDGDWVGKPLWTNSEGDRLWDYGVDEEADMVAVGEDDEDEDVPIAELIRRRKKEA